MLWRRALTLLLGFADALKQAKSAALAAAQRTFCWERQEKCSLEAINHALGPPHSDSERMRSIGTDRTESAK